MSPSDGWYVPAWPRYYSNLRQIFLLPTNLPIEFHAKLAPAEMASFEQFDWFLPFTPFCAQLSPFVSITNHLQDQHSSAVGKISFS